jgi:hypothetical protein
MAILSHRMKKKHLDIFNECFCFSFFFHCFALGHVALGTICTYAIYKFIKIAVGNSPTVFLKKKKRVWIKYGTPSDP